VQRPFATVVVGGMLFGPVMLVIVVPALQALVLSRQDEQAVAPRTLNRA
jgi:cobalt-zinc-cadmium resistance protein CzcA